jgi:hypothetical protein
MNGMAGYFALEAFALLQSVFVPVGTTSNSVLGTHCAHGVGCLCRSKPWLGCGAVALQRRLLARQRQRGQRQSGYAACQMTM